MPISTTHPNEYHHLVYPPVAGEYEALARPKSTYHFESPFEPMPSRRRVLRLWSLAAAGAIGGCTTRQADSKPVDVLLQNDDTEERRLTVAVEGDTDGELFRTEETIPADDGEDLGEVRIEHAFEGTTDDHFTVRVWLDGEPAGTFDYEITCPDENRFSLLVEHEPYSPDDGEPVDYVPDRCGE